MESLDFGVVFEGSKRTQCWFSVETGDNNMVTAWCACWFRTSFKIKQTSTATISHCIETRGTTNKFSFPCQDDRNTLTGQDVWPENVTPAGLPPVTPRIMSSALKRAYPNPTVLLHRRHMLIPASIHPWWLVNMDHHSVLLAAAGRWLVLAYYEIGRKKKATQMQGHDYSGHSKSRHQTCGSHLSRVMCWGPHITWHYLVPNFFQKSLSH